MQSKTATPVGWRLGKGGEIHRMRLIKYPNGSVYKGEVVNGKLDGFGELCTSTFKYVGSFKCGLIDGQGVMTWNAFKENGVEVVGKIYEGSFVRGKKEGYGIIVDGKGGKYEGLWHQDRFHGKGKFTKADESQEGEFVNGKLHCDQGKILFDNGDVYEGAVSFGFMHSTLSHISYGYGCGSYSGQFHYSLKQGIGTRKYIDQSIYRGSFKHNKINGTGTMHFGKDHKLFERYTGDWVDGYFHGEFGELHYKNESEIKCYKGGFYRGVFHRKGRLLYRDGGYYDGDFSALIVPLTGCKHGWGKRVWASGNEFEGSWERNCMLEGRYFDSLHNSHYVGTFLGGKKSGTIAREIWRSPDGKAYYDPCLKWKHKGNEICRYTGGYKFGFFHGKGKFSSQNGRSYDGEWKLGKRHGYGVAILRQTFQRGNPDKMFIGKYGSLYKPIIYEGQWEEGHWHGKGKLTYPNGKIKVGHFVKGHLED